MRVMIAKPLLAGLLATTVLTVIAVLKPEPLATGADDLLAERASALPRHGGGPLSESAEAPWQRRLLPPPAAAVLGQGFSPVAARPVVVAPVPAAPVLPAVPTVPQPDFSYLGRMVREGQTVVFLARGEDVEVVELGGMVGHDWRVDRIAADSVELRYLPLNETRRLAVSEK